jgi:hypothetical protein
MPSTAQIQGEIARLQKAEAAERKKISDAEREVAKARAAARDRRTRAARSVSGSTIRSHLREAERLEKRASDQQKKVADAAKKLADIGAKLAGKHKVFETANREADRRRGREEERRRQADKRHAREVARLAQPATHIHELRVLEAPKPEKLRVLYLAANPELDLRVDVEVRMVREAVKKALHRDLVEIDHRPAATPEDLLDGINEMRPHVVHFAGHGGEGSVLFDDAEIRVQGGSSVRGHRISFALLGRAVGATDSPPTLLLLNACDTLEGTDVLLGVTPVIIGMASSVSDLAAGVFASRFYSAIASAQSVASALEQGKVSVDAAGLDEGWKADAVAREDIDLSALSLVHPPPV